LTLIRQRAVYSDDEVDDPDNASNESVVADLDDEKEEENKDGTIAENNLNITNTRTCRNCTDGLRPLFYLVMSSHVCRGCDLAVIDS
jgi:hypothetical protein